MDWFQRLTGFAESGYEPTQRRLQVHDGKLIGARGQAWSMGRLELPSLAGLRAQAAALRTGHGRTGLSFVSADVRELHAKPRHRQALFQVASQFNLLEMLGPDVTPEHGVSDYQYDATQGPACAMAAGAATIYRNYLVPVGAGMGQRADAQLDALADLGQALARDGRPPWRMCNGYALCTAEQLDTIDAQLHQADEAMLDAWRGLLRVGLHWDVDVTDRPAPGHRVSQAFCSALPVAYNALPSKRWARFARLVLEAAYEATLLAAAINRQRTGVATVFLTRLGGGAFGNEAGWITAAIRRGLGQVNDAGLDVRLVSYGSTVADEAELGDLAAH